MFDYLNFKRINEDYLIDYITVFADKAEQWRSSIENGQPGPSILELEHDDKPPLMGPKI